MDLAAPFGAGYHPARAFLLRRGLYVLLAFDAWLVMLEHGGRYGAGGFNVAHFAWLDALLPVPSPDLYVGLLIATGMAALCMTFLTVSRAAKLLLAIAYTFSWAISLHDSYQHHYLLSWLLLWSAFIPEVTAAQLRENTPARVGAVGLTQTAFTCAIVYLFTAISKSSEEWRSGAVLRRLSDAAGGVLDPLCDPLMRLAGFEQEGAFALIAASIILLQGVIAVAYCAVPGRDDASGRLRTILCSAGWLGSLAFHGGAERTGMFQIGWFSYYMLTISSVLFAPAAWLAGFARALSLPALAFERLAPAAPRALELLLLLTVALFVTWLGQGIDLPGAFAACALLALLGGGVGLWWLRQGHVLQLRALMLAGLVAGAALWSSLTQTGVRFDFYRRWAGEVARLGETEHALALYRKAERYAPPGQSRAAKIHELERRLARPRPGR